MAGAAGQTPATLPKTTLGESCGPRKRGDAGTPPLGSYSAGSSAAVYAPGSVNGLSVEVLVDTGSAVTLVHKRLMDRIGLEAGLEGVAERVVSANGQPLGILGKVHLTLGLAGIKELHPVLVADDLTQECLIGVDFLARHRFQIDFAAGVLCANGRSVDLHCGGGGEGISVDVCGRVSVAETVTIPGYHEMVFPAKFEGNGLCSGSGTSIVEPSPNFADRHSLLMARVVAQPRGNVVPVRLINPYTDPVILYKDATLGTITALEECGLPQEGESPEPGYSRSKNPVNRQERRRRSWRSCSTWRRQP